MHNVNWDDLRIALAIHRHKTFSSAAKSLNTTHTTIGRRLSGLESGLGVRLFERTPEGLVATLAGERIIATATTLEQAILDTQRKVEGQDDELKGALRVSTLDFLFHAYREAFTGFIESFPSIDITISAEMEPLSLNRREADVVLRLSPSPPEGLIGRRVAKMGFSVFAHSRLVESIGKDAPLDAYPWIGIDQTLSDRWLTTWLKQHAPNAKIKVRIGENSILTRQLILSGAGVFFLPTLEGRSLGLCEIGAPSSGSAVDVWLLTHRDLQKTKRVKTFMDYFARSVKAIAC